LVTAEDSSIAFYPLFPWLIVGCFYQRKLLPRRSSSLHRLRCRSDPVAELVQLDYPTSVAMRSVWFFLIFPTHIFFMLGTVKVVSRSALASILYRIERWW
jgi:hypothetical protein